MILISPLCKLFLKQEKTIPEIPGMVFLSLFFKVNLEASFSFGFGHIYLEVAAAEIFSV